MTKIIGGNKPKRADIFEIFAGKITTSKAISGLEHIDDLQMDLIFIMFDALLEKEIVSLNETQKQSYQKLKEQWETTKSVDLESQTYEIDYSLNGDGENGNPNGLKRIAREAQKEYRKILENHGYKN